MLRVPVAALAVPAAVVVRPLRVEVFVDSCSQGPVAPGGHLAVCGPLGCLVIVCGRDSRSDDSHPPCRNHHNGGNCHFSGSCYRGDSRPLGGNRRRGGSPLSVGSHNRDGWPHRACSRPRGSSPPPNRGCRLCIGHGGEVARTLWVLVAEWCSPFVSLVALFVVL